MRRFLTPGWILSHLFVLAMVVVMLNLGFWQLQRLDDRKDRNDEVRISLQAEPRGIAELLAADAPDHTAVSLSGAFRPDLAFLVANRSFDTQAGSWLVVPVEMADGRVVAVSRGWVPRSWAAGVDEREVLTPSGEIDVRGRLFDSVGGGRIGSGDVARLPEISRMDLDDVEELLGVDVVDRWVQLDAPAPPQGELPIPVPPTSLDEGPHLSYAFQWFFFSVATVVAYGLILRKRHREMTTGEGLVVDDAVPTP